METRPGSARLGPFEKLAQLDSPWPGAAVVLLAGATWALLCLLLASGGHAPSVTLVPIDRESYYLAQAGFVVPTLLVQWGLCTWVSTTLARSLGGSGSWRATAAPLGVALGGPLLVLFLLPDLIAYTVAGFSALGPLIRITGPLALGVTLALSGVAIRAAHTVGRGRSYVAAGAGVIVQAVLGGVLLR